MMTKRCPFFACGFTFFSLMLFSAIGACAGPDDDVATEFIGTWHVSSATNSMILCIKPDGEALFININGGAHGIDNTTWKPVEGGILVEGMPRFRFWKGINPTNARVAMEPFPPEMTDASMQQFPLTFFMRRMDSKRNDSKGVRERPLPSGWTEATLPAEWDQTAGRRRDFAPKAERPDGIEKIQPDAIKRNQ